MIELSATGGNKMLNVDIYKTAHALLAKHGDTLIEALDEKMKIYGEGADQEAIAILGNIRTAAEQLMMRGMASNMVH